MCSPRRKISDLIRLWVRAEEIWEAAAEGIIFLWIGINFQVGGKHCVRAAFACKAGNSGGSNAGRGHNGKFRRREIT